MSHGRFRVRVESSKFVAYRTNLTLRGLFLALRDRVGDIQNAEIPMPARRAEH